MSKTNFGSKYVKSVLLIVNGHFTGKRHSDRFSFSVSNWFLFCLGSYFVCD